MSKESRGKAKSTQDHAQTGAPQRGAAPAQKHNASPTPGGAAPSLRTQATRLGDARVQRAQRHALAAQIGRAQGNRHVGRVIASMTPRSRTGKAAARATAGENSGEMVGEVGSDHGSSGPPTMAGARPPDPAAGKHTGAAGVGSGASVAMRTPSERGGAQQGAVVQREGPGGDIASQGLLSRLTGQANAARGQVRQAATQSTAQVRTQASAQNQALQANAQTASAQMQNRAAAQVQTIEAQANAGRAQMQTQAATASSRLQAGVGDVQAEATSGGQALEADAQARTSALEAEAAGVGAQVGGEWATQREQVLTETNALETASQETQEQTRQQAQEVLSRGGPGAQQEAERTVEGGWRRLGERTQPVRKMFRGLGRLFGRWVRRHWMPRQRRAQGLREWVRGGVLRLRDRLRRRVGQLIGLAQGAIQRVLAFRDRVKNGLGILVRRAVEFLGEDASRGLDDLLRLRNRVRDWIRERAQAALAQLRERANSVIDTIRNLAAPIMRFLSGPVNSILARLRGNTAPVLSFLRRGVNTVRDHLTRAGGAVRSRLQSLGQRVFRNTLAIGRRVTGVIGLAFRAVRDLLGGDLGGVRRLWTGVREGVTDIGRRVIDLVGTAPLRIRALVWEPIRDLARTGVEEVRAQVRGIFGRVRQGWSALKQSMRRGGPGTGPEQSGPAGGQGSQTGTQHTAQGG